MPEYLAPGVFVEEVGSGPAGLEGRPTSIAAFIGWTPTGPTDVALPIKGLQEFERLYGSGHPGSWLAHGVRHFFQNGGTDALIVRISGPRGGALVPGTRAFEEALLDSGGVRLLDDTDGFNLLCVPGEATPTVLMWLQGFCRERRAFLIAECRRNATVGSLTGGPEAVLTGPDSMNSALYFPWIRARDPVSGKLRTFPPSGFVAGVIARTDGKHGVWMAPAGTDASVTGAHRPVTAINDTENGLLNPQAVNCIRSFPGHGTVLWGARTLAGRDVSPSDWRYVNVRRLALHIEESIVRGTEWVAFEPNDAALWTRLRALVETFLMALFRQGAFQGTTPRHAFFVRCDATTTTQDDIDRGDLHLLVGFAPLRPAEFVVLPFDFRTRASAH